MAIKSLTTSKPLPARKTFEARNVKAIDINLLQLMLTAFDVFTIPKSNMGDFAHKRKDTFIGIVDVYASGVAVHDQALWETIQCVAQFQVISARRKRRQIEHRFRRTRSEVDHLR